MWAHLRKKEVYYIEGVTLLVLYLRSRVICRDNLSTGGGGGGGGGGLFVFIGYYRGTQGAAVKLKF